MARRLLLSYLLLIGLTVVAMALVIQRVTTETFSRYLSSQATAHSEMLPVMLTGYYTRHGSWAGVQPDITEASFMIGAPLALADANGQIVAATLPDLIGHSAAGLTASTLIIPVTDSKNETIGVVYVQPSLAHQRADQAFLSNVSQALLVTGLSVGVLAAGVGIFLSRSISRPLAEMSRAAGLFAQGDYTARVSPHGPDEMAALGQTFNLMAERVGRLELLRRELVANVSHDLRTPLTVIRGYVEGLRSGQIADRRSAEMAFEAMHAEVGRLLHLVGDLRQVTVLDAGAWPLDCRPVNLVTFAGEVLNRVALLAAAGQVSLVNQISPDLPPHLLDPERMGQALFNLLENAIRHTPAGGTVTLSATAEETFLHLTIRDTGQGIPAEHLPHIFERFYRADRARSSAEGRAGLGLAIVKAIVEAHGGTVQAASDGQPGRGSTFTISLPRG